MAVADERAGRPDTVGTALASAPTRAAGPVDDETPIRMPPARSEPSLVQTLQFSLDPLGGGLRARARFGDVWQVRLLGSDQPFVLTSHPDHVEALFRAKAADAPSLTGESPLRPILGPNSVLTAVGERHMRQRKLLLPRFHGESVARYAQLISDVIEREIDTWPVGRSFALAPRMQAVTLEVIMAGVFGIEGTPEPGSPEERMRSAVRRIGRLSTHPLWHLVELWQFGRLEPKGALRAVMSVIDRQLYAAIRARRAAGSRPGATDVMSLLLDARDERGRGLSDEELRDELLTLVLAGHETTANSLAWTFERLLRTPAAYGRLRDLVRSQDPKADAYVEATVHEGMRTRPVIPIVVRRVKRRWRLGQYVVPANTPVAVSIVALHHRADIYPDPRAFRPERFVGRTPGTYTWIPFGGGIRRCLGSALAMAELRVVLEAIARRTDLTPHAAKPEPARQRNVTMIPRHGGRVVLTAKRA
jgi:cytochrome P450